MVEDLSGQIFGRLTVVKYAGNYKWDCLCSCGTRKSIRGSDLRSGRTNSCGCLRKELASENGLIDLLGKRFGRLEVIEFSGTNSRGAMWKCKCDCGNEAIVKSEYLINGDTKSCGCLKSDVLKERNYKHGQSKQSRLYSIWKGMRERCYNENYEGYKNYGGRGITVCKEWDDFKNFELWANNNGYDESLPADECSIDRIDNDGMYSPSNCRWTSRTQQARNTRRNRYLTYRGETKLLVEWGETYNIDPKYIAQRIDKYGWSVEDAITTPVLPNGVRRGR